MNIDKDIHYYDYADRKLERSVSNKIALLFLSLILSLIIIFTLVSSEYKQMKLMKLEEEIMEDNLKLRENMISRIASFNKTNKDLDDEDLEKIYNLLPDDDNFEGHLANINNFAISNRILIKEFSVNSDKGAKPNEPQKNESVSNLKKFQINFSLSGNFLDFMSFLDSVEKNIPLVDLKSLNITKVKTKKDESGDETALNYEVTFLFYYL